MRKGRSQRKTRGSLPPTSKRPQSRLNAASDASGGPQVVVGLTAPRCEEALETLETRASDAERLEIVRERSLEIVRESLELVRESLELRETDPQPEPQEQPQVQAEEQPEERESYLAESVEPPKVDGHVEAPHVEAHARVQTLTFAAADPFQDTPDDEPVNVEATAPVKSAPQMTLPTPDEMSIPPMGDLSVEVEPIADRFFSEGELVAARGIDHDSQHEEWDERAHKSVRKSLPEVVQRRARFAKYVRWAVGGAAVVCLAALARTAIPTSAPAASASLASLESSQAREPSQARELREAPVAKAADPAVAAEPVKAPESVAAPVVAVPVAAAAEAPAAAVEPAAPAAPAAPATSDKTALQEKNDARRSLERGKLADAIAAGERSVALDATDGEAWLLLGAAYQEKGNMADARHSYASCVKEGKRGPLGECRAMLR